MQVSDQMFNDWVRRHQRLLFGIAYWWTGSRTDAEELTQEAFLQAYRSRTVMSRLARARQQLHELMKAPTKLVLMQKAESL